MRPQAAALSTAGPNPHPNAPLRRFRRVREASIALVAGLAPEDACVQSMPDASPAKWHLAHTTWFFEQFVLGREPGYKPVHAQWSFLFNSYYQSVGPMHSRPARGLLSRPTLAEILDYRHAIDARVEAALSRTDADRERDVRLDLGLHHEQQHQELLLTDIKHLFSLNPLEPVFRTSPSTAAASMPLPQHFIAGAEGLAEIGYSGPDFAFDCETPRHRILLHPHALANRCVTNSEFREFIRDGGYTQPTLWLSEGWNAVVQRGWQRPLYWSADMETEFSLNGRRVLDAHAPVCHVSFFEADAFARWAGARLPLEAEWENLAATQAVSGNFVDSGLLHPRAAAARPGLQQVFGDVWEWTASPYVSYPGFRPLSGSLGEYNGKFMSGQYVLRGGSCATPADHIRASYRNFFTPVDRWQFMGLRLARDA
ncbi:MAG: ergothioneine biosynthesis protein EgtB [Panacagrimonas sp.]